MIKVIITYTNNHVEKTSVKNHEVATKFTEAVLSVYKHDGILNTIDSIVLIDSDSHTSTMMYPGGKNNAHGHDLSNSFGSACGCGHLATVLEGDKT